VVRTSLTGIRNVVDVARRFESLAEVTEVIILIIAELQSDDEWPAF
jgi:hypothetical protein